MKDYSASITLIVNQLKYDTLPILSDSLFVKNELNSFSPESTNCKLFYSTPADSIFDVDGLLDFHTDEIICIVDEITFLRQSVGYSSGHLCIYVYYDTFTCSIRPSLPLLKFALAHGLTFEIITFPTCDLTPTSDQELEAE